MSPAAPPPRRRRPPEPPPAEDKDPDERLRAIIEIGVGVIEDEMEILTEPCPGSGGRISTDAVDRIMALTAKSSEIRGQVVRADAAVTRKKLTLAAIEKAIAALSQDERAHLVEKLGGGKEGNCLS